jgi:hypothetical protein
MDRTGMLVDGPAPPPQLVQLEDMSMYVSPSISPQLVDGSRTFMDRPPSPTLPQ